MKTNVLNSKEVRSIKELIKKQWGCDFSTELAWLLSEKDRIYLITRDVEKIDMSKLRVDVMGLYFGELKGDELRLSVEGSQLVGPLATKGILELDDAEARAWLKGQDFEKKTDIPGFVIMKNKDDFLGCGKVKNNRVLNFMPKNRRILAED